MITEMVKELKKLFSHPFDFMKEEKTEVEIKNGVISVRVNGENVDPKSKEGREIVKNIGMSVRLIEECVDKIANVRVKRTARK